MPGQLTPEALAAMARKIAAEGGASLPDLFQCIGQGAADIAAAIRSGDHDLGEGAASAFLNALEMLPESLRKDIAYSVTERPCMAENPHLERLAW